MKSEQLSLAAALAGLVAFGAVSWWLLLQEPLEVDAARLGALPLQVDDWRGRDIELDSGVEEILDADFNLQRSYVHPLGDLVWLYVGYYGTERGGRPEHTPWECYPAAGWVIARHEVVDAVILEGAEPVRANELVVEKGADRRLVLFWYQSVRRSGLLGGLDQTVDRFLTRLRYGRADGSLVRLSTPIAPGEDEASARTRLRAFGREILPLLESHWPREQARLASR